jgi:hypothetical protein
MKVIVIVYFLYTLRFAIIFNQTDVFFFGKLKLLHNIGIWLVPFIWIAILKQLSKPIQGSHQYRKKKLGEDNYSLESGSDGDYGT